MKKAARGILLMNLGSPDSASVKDVRSYLNEFLMDERVIDKPFLSRFLLVKGIITPFRAPKSAEAYRLIWTKKGSPLIELTRQLQRALREHVEAPIEIAMRYGSPSVRGALEALQKEDVEEVLAVPLYPHYAMSSYETAVEHAKKFYALGDYSFRLQFAEPYYRRPEYIHALSGSIKPYLTKEFDSLLFSYHGIPERHVHKTDPSKQHCLKASDCCDAAAPAHAFCYRHQCIVTAKLTAKKLGLSSDKFSFSFQSRLGRDEWLKPYTAVRFEEMPSEGIKKLLIVCPSFASDCLETLEEIAMRGKESFLHAGGEEFTFIPCLNTQTLWVKALADWINAFEKEPEKMLTCR